MITNRLLHPLRRRNWWRIPESRHCYPGYSVNFAGCVNFLSAYWRLMTGNSFEQKEMCWLKRFMVSTQPVLQVTFFGMNASRKYMKRQSAIQKNYLEHIVHIKQKNVCFVQLNRINSLLKCRIMQNHVKHMFLKLVISCLVSPCITSTMYVRKQIETIIKYIIMPLFEQKKNNGMAFDYICL